MAAIDLLDLVNQKYDNTFSGLSAISGQAAIDEIAANYLTGNETITLTGDVSGSGTTSISVTVANNSHTHIWSNITSTPTTVAGYGITDAYTITEIDALTWDTSDITTGTFADARIAQSNVTQHEAALTITESQISDLTHYTHPATHPWSILTSTPTTLSGYGITDAYTQAQVNALTWNANDITAGTFADARIAASNVTQHVSKTLIDGLNVDADTLDGIDGANLLRSDVADTVEGILTYNNYIGFFDQPIQDTSEYLYKNTGQLFWKNRRLKGCIVKEVAVGTEVTTDDNKYYELGRFFFASLEGVLRIELLFSGSGGGSGATYNLPLTFSLDYLVRYGLPAITQDAWYALTPDAAMPRHYLTAADDFELQIKNNGNTIDVRAVVRDPSGPVSSTLNLEASFYHSNDFTSCTYTELTGTGTDATVYDALPAVRTGLTGYSLFGSDSTFRGNITPQVDSTYDLGTDTERFKTLYVDTIWTTANINVAGTVDGRDVSVDGAKLDNIEIEANNYVHPNDGVDPGAALTGATVFSDITVNAAGHVTGSATRNLTLADLGFTGDTDANNYVHPGYSVTDINTSGAVIVDSITTTAEGHVSGMSTRTLTLANLGYTGATDANNYSHPNHTGEVTSTGDGATVLTVSAISNRGEIIGGLGSDDQLLIRNNGTNVLQKMSFNTFETYLEGALSLATSRITSGTFADARIAESNVTQHEAALTITESQISDLSHYTHPSYVTTNIDTSGATIVDSITTNSTGHITAMGTRTLTLADLGYTGATDANNYVFPYTVSSSAGNNTVVQRTGSGYIFSNYINTTANVTATTPSHIWVETGSDSYHRKQTQADFISNLGLISSSATQPLSFTIRNASPTINFRDTDHRGFHIHCNSNLLYFLNANAVDGTTWTAPAGGWAFYINSTNNAATFGGTITAASNITAYSDRRIKKNIVTIDDALSKVCKMRGVYYNRKDLSEEDNAIRRTGVIAQELEEVLPEVVRENTEKTVDDSGKTLPGGRKRLTVDYGNIAGILIEAIKELTEKVEKLENDAAK